ncbi:hypothetical protein GA0061100_11534 [Rhizobium hainanense]|uniref:Uncharacterized protein n=1 Tax=Rhizobium hainanense TaxID=52131 RepID=A0A1C3WCA3_9HYPH|nr:hypothetical protein GA0061100_11534 [Rhizobium hainanense]
MTIERNEFRNSTRYPQGNYFDGDSATNIRATCWPPRSPSTKSGRSWQHGPPTYSRSIPARTSGSRRASVVRSAARTSSKLFVVSTTVGTLRRATLPVMGSHRQGGGHE